ACVMAKWLAVRRVLPRSNPAKLDFTTFFGSATGLAPATVPNVDASVDTEVQGSVALNAFDVLIAKGSFNLQLGTVTKASTTYQEIGRASGRERVYEVGVV